jgi:hypothetical protein
VSLKAVPCHTESPQEEYPPASRTTAAETTKPMLRRIGGLVALFSSYLAMFAGSCVPWLKSMTGTIPLITNPNDAQLHIWILASVAHGLVAHPLSLLDANINYPAPAQLTGSDHFLSTQLLFAPLYWTTGNPVLAANLVVLLSYPLAAMAMHLLLRTLGFGFLVSWLAGVLFAMGPLRVPMNLQIFQFLNLYLPLVVLALCRLRDRPAFRSAAYLWIAFTLAIFSSYYMAIMASLTGAVWASTEFARRRLGRGRFVALGLAASSLAVVMLWAFSMPYIRRAEPLSPSSVPILPELPAVWDKMVALLAPPGSRLRCSPTTIALAVIGVIAACLPRLGVRRAVVPSLILAILGLIAMNGFPSWLVTVSTGSPLRFFRYAYRFIVVAGFGIVVLAACGLEAIRRLLGSVAGAVAAVLFALSLWSMPGTLLFRPFPRYEVQAQAQRSNDYELLGKVIRDHGGGPLLELPLSGEVELIRGRGGRGGHATLLRTNTLQPDSMLGSTHHWLPLVAGFTGYQPAHRKLLLETIVRLPEGDALDDLVDMTHLRWIVLRPAADWANPGDRAAFLRGLLLVDHARAVWSHAGWTLFRIDRNPEHPDWFQAIASGRLPGHTVLGTPLAQLDPGAAVGRVRAVRAPQRVAAGRPIVLALEVTNAGDAAWPVAAPPKFGFPGMWYVPNASRRYTVELFVRWRALDANTEGVPAPTHSRLRRDVPPGESVREAMHLDTPSAAGDYELTVGVRQVSGARFEGAGNEPLTLRMSIVKPGGF